MSKVYIRSQEREQLILFGEGIYSVYYMFYPEISLGGNTTTQPQHAVVAEGNNKMIHLGIYESKERCLAILDEIQKECSAYYRSTGGFSIPDTLFDMPAVYQMPEQ